MKSMPTGLAADIAARVTTFATALKITRTDSAIFGFTSHNVDDVISGVTYKSDPGLDVTSVSASVGSGVGNLQLTTLDDGSVFARSDILGGVWRGAQWVLFRYNYTSLSDGIDILLHFLN